jgi:DNA-binding winged helix-turn-helix (wHTH) protein
MSVLIKQFADVVPTAELIRTAWPSETATANALRVHLTRLRRRISPLGLEVVTVREHGFLLQESITPAAHDT